MSGTAAVLARLSATYADSQPLHDITEKMSCARIEDVYRPGLIKVFAVPIADTM